MIRLRIVLGLALASSCSGGLAPEEAAEPCTEHWLQGVEERLPTGDSEGHGPDIGSLEWRSVVEFKLGIRGNTDVPSRETDDWCYFINDRIAENPIVESPIISLENF